MICSLFQCILAMKIRSLCGDEAFVDVVGYDGTSAEGYSTPIVQRRSTHNAVTRIEIARRSHLRRNVIGHRSNIRRFGKRTSIFRHVKASHFLAQKAGKCFSMEYIHTKPFCGVWGMEGVLEPLGPGFYCLELKDLKLFRRAERGKKVKKDDETDDVSCY